MLDLDWAPRKRSLLVIVDVFLVCVNSLFISVYSGFLQGGSAHPGRLISRVPADDSQLSCVPGIVASSSGFAALLRCHRGPAAPAFQLAAVQQRPPPLRPSSRALGRENEFSLAKGSVLLLVGLSGQVGSWAHLHAAGGSSCCRM